MKQPALADALALRAEVPICAFRPHESREYQDTYPFPAPSAVYGMLLSLCGIEREQKDQHLGILMALAMEGAPERAKVFRKFRRGAELGSLRPDYQDLLIGVVLWIWLHNGEDQAIPTLCERVSDALRRPETVNRRGGLSLGESSYLVDAISIREPDMDKPLQFLKPAPTDGFYSLPVWVDHTRNRSYRPRFAIEKMTPSEGLNRCWVPIVES